MRPLSLTMQAFGSYGKKTGPIDFTRANQNLFLITGDTGAGKTTIFDAIVFALYGEAGSNYYKKDGMDLQSQFADYAATPFVELTFSEKAGGETKVYTVRRVPRHMRRLKRGDGVKAESEQVSLVMPDGMEYPPKETNKKLEEIVGLTKEQFMQVAMIAQGEFMELLRASSDEKKKIFRKLFHTGFYEGIIRELENRKKEKFSDMASIRTACQTEIGHVVLPEEDENVELLQTLKKRILAADKLSVTDMESFLAELQIFCDRLRDEKEEKEKLYKKADGLRDETRDAFINAKSLADSFEQLREAEQALAECTGAEDEIADIKKQARKIQDAYEIREIYHRFWTAENTVSDTEKHLKEQSDVMPDLKKAYAQAEKEEKENRKQQEAELKTFTAVSERVERALWIFDEIKKMATDAEEKENAWNEAKKKVRQTQKDLEEMEKREKEWREQLKALEGAEGKLELWQRERGEADEIEKDIHSLKKAESDVVKQKKRVDKAKCEYEAARKDYAERAGEYEVKQTAFLDAQAGFIAKEKLREGKPCPVCGSLTHPHPCEITGLHGELTREMIDTLAAETAKSRKTQEEKSIAAQSASEVLKEKEKNLDEAVERLRIRMAKHIPGASEEFTVMQAETLLKEWKHSLEIRGTAIQSNAETYREIQISLKDVDEKKQSLKQKAEQAVQEESDKKAAFATSRETLKRLEADREYPSEQAARETCSAAERVKKDKDKAYEISKDHAEKIKTKMDSAKTLIRRYKEELLGQKQEYEQQKAIYDSVLEEKDFDESEWRNVIEAYPKSEIESLQEKVKAHDIKKAAAKSAAELAKKAIGGRKCPVMEELERKKNEAEENLRRVQRELEQCKAEYKANSDAYQALAPKMKERGRIMREYTKIDSLYSRLAGKVSGARMDIETFVQRYYLQRILYAANVRFSDMSAGQFELRLVEEEQAGTGRNRGLDLMVYSTVTGKVREVKTLSGGESFMAALAMALAMADQIQENSAAINLDIMFIDEGFGSLDERSRGQAVKVLKQMAGGSKLVGIISHVTELKQEIEDQMIITKDEAGSHVKWQIS